MKKVADRVAVLGLGLIGGSLAFALKRGRLAGKVCAYARREKTRKLALKIKAVDEVFKTPQEAVKGADIVVICVPVLATSVLAKKCIKNLKQGCVVTDVGSTKARVTSEMEKLLSRGKAVFVGSHPIAGSEETGLESARSDIFRGATVVVTVPKGKRVSLSGVKKVKALWKALGARVEIMTPDEHDCILAGTSHLPHVVASAMVQAVLGSTDSKNGAFCGRGFKDVTRIAGSSEDLWHDIIKTNPRHVCRLLDELTDETKKIRNMIRKKNFSGIKKYLAKSRCLRRGLEK